MTKKNFYRLAILSAVLFVATSLYVYARFTVDDAFITWRYGKNLVHHGIWNYSPNLIDPTQAYTNPIFALLGVIPPLFGWDVVFFFKIVSLATYVALFLWMLKISGHDWLLVLLFLGLPAAVVHTFSGLETMLYVFLVGALLVALHQRRLPLSLGLCLGLFTTRPESWILVCALPAYWYFVTPMGQDGPPQPARSFRRALSCLAVLGLPLAAYFLLHILLFGDALPNTFYAKSGSVFRPKFALYLVLNTLPLIPLLGRRLWPLIAVCAFLFGGMIMSYSSSDLQMNFSHRFAFHVFGSCYLFGLYLAALRSSEGEHGEKEASEGKFGLATRCIGYVSRKTALRTVMVALLLIFFMICGKWPTYEATYYQRALASHAELGKKINQIALKYHIKSFSVGDAGMLPYHSDLCVLDNVGLASAKLTRGKPTEALFESYGLDMVILFTKNGQPDLGIYRQEQLFAWAQKRGMTKVGDLYWQPDYVLSVYSIAKLPEIEEICAQSRRLNSVQDAEMRRVALLMPPWSYWHE